MNGENSLASYADALLLNDSERGFEGHLCGLSIESLVNGQATEVVYDLLSLSERRKHGVFFSGPAWAGTLVEQLDLERWERFIDPSVGTGDLLLEICRKLPLKPTVELTLLDWSKRLVAVDLRASFLRIAWARIQAVAFLRHHLNSSEKDRVTSFPMPETFRVGDALKMPLELRRGDCVIMNPPYQRILARADSFVGKGKRSAAAFHLEHVLCEAPEGVGIVALIPDVLRSGSSYTRFRTELDQRLRINRFNSFGHFGSSADIDVAILYGVTETIACVPDTTVSDSLAVVGDSFNVSVGPVVPHRAPSCDEKYGYLTAKNAPAWGEIKEPIFFESFKARLEKGPFVIVRRTSSPSDRKRARATLVSSKQTFLVENHLLILRPQSGLITHCKALIKILKDPRTDNWLNDKIRCRHLTVKALTELPWWGGE